jgi:hypothetical protein
MGTPNKANTVDATGDAAGMPGGGIRTVISLLLVIHLFCLLVVFAGLYSPSELQTRLLVVLRPYTQTLALDLNQATHFSPYFIVEAPAYDPTYPESPYDPFYADPRIELRLGDADSPREAILPQAGFPGSPAYRREQTLARYLSALSEAESDTASTELARSILTHYDAQAGDLLSCRRHLPLDPQTVVSREPEQSDPDDASHFQAVRRFEVVSVDARGYRDILPSEATGAVAPVDPGAGGKAGAAGGDD